MLSLQIIYKVMRKSVFIIFAVLFFYACGDRQAVLNKKLKQAITRYMETSVAGFKVDSIQILGIDSLNIVQYAYFNKVVYQNHEEALQQNYLLYITPINEQEWDEQERIQLQLDKIKMKITHCDSILLDPHADTLHFQYFFVAAKLFGKKKNAPQVHEIGFPIDKQFKVMELDME